MKRETIDAVEAIVKAAPPVGVSGLVLFGIPLQEWVLLLTGIYTLAMLLNLLWRWRRDWKATR